MSTRVMTWQDAMDIVYEACRDMGCEDEWHIVLNHISGLESELEAERLGTGYYKDTL